jgi:hypothetical protein
MPKLALFAVSLAFLVQAVPKITRFIPTSDVVRIGEMASRDEGYDPEEAGTYLDVLRKNGKEPIPGYASIGLYKDGHMVRYYSIRVDSGDIVDPMDCKAFQYPNLIQLKRNMLKEFGAKEVSLEEIAKEIGCDNMKIVPPGDQAGSSKRRK